MVLREIPSTVPQESNVDSQDAGKESDRHLKMIAEVGNLDNDTKSSRRV